MRRKDILIIAIILITITFGTVFTIYYEISNSNIFEKIEVSNQGKYYENGWEKEIVSEIINDVPVPIGFTYVEGERESGIIIKNSNTGEKYIWIPYVETNLEKYEEVSELSLATSTYETKENIEKYNGFYVALDERTEEEIFQKYIKENSKDFDSYYGLKNLGYEGYKELYKNITEEEFDLYKEYSQKYDIEKLNNKSRTTSVETHTMTSEELAILESYKENIGKEIKVKDLRVLTVLGKVYANTEEVEEIDEQICKKIEDKNGEIVYVPKGFKEVEGTTVKEGFKITNTDNLSFIWIPVEDVEKVKEKFISYAKQANLEESTVNAYEKYEDDKESEEYKELIESIKKYGGFYISEAELGYDENGNTINRFRSMVEKGGEGTGYNYVSNGDYYRNVDSGNYAAEGTALREKQSTFKLTYDNAIKIAKELYSDSEVAVSHLTYGIEYDAVVNYLIETGKTNKEIAFKDSTSVGKYKELNGTKSLWEKEHYLNGIYGLAGNLSEITQEKDGENIVVRGGSWNDVGTTALASRISKEESKIDIGQDVDGSDKTMGMVGFRACLYIKTEYEENEELETKKEKAIQEIKDYINNTSVKVDGKNYFSSSKKEGTEEYEVQLFNAIIANIEKRLEEETSSAGFGKIVQYGKDEIDNLKENIVLILEYPKDVEGYDYGETSGDCWAIKENTVEQMKKLIWKNGVLTDENGVVTTYLDIRQRAETEIENKRNEYKSAKIKEYIDDYPTAPDKDHTKKIKERAKEELNYTNNLAELSNIAVRYQEIIEVANRFEHTELETMDKYEKWKVEYEATKTEYLNKIATEAKTKEDAERLETEGNIKIKEIIEKAKKAENRKYIFAGDSRFVHMQYVKEGNTDTFLCKSSMGYNYFVGIMDSIKNAETENSVLIIGFGINDLWNADKYIEYVNGLNLKSEIYFLTVNPVDEAKEKQHGYAIKTSKVVEFNNKIKAGAKNYKVLDTYEYLMQNGFETSDGVHYTNNTSKAIYKYIKEQT